MTKFLHGKVHGRTIEFNEELNLAEGQEVEVLVKVVAPTGEWGEGIRRSAGGWSGHPEIDSIMDDIYQSRKVERRPQLEKP